MKRKIAAIIAADVAGYSRLVEQNEEDTLRRFIAASAVFKTLVQAHYGRIFNTAGDAILAEFSSSVEAVRCAAAIQARVRELNCGQPHNRRLLFRIGISVGDVIEHETDLLGDGVNIAARLQTLATPGGLSISHWVQEQIAGKIDLAFRDAGWHNVRNIAKPVHVFLADIGDNEAPFTRKPAPRRVTSIALPRRAIAIVTATGIVALSVAALLWPRAGRIGPVPNPAPVMATVPALPRLSTPPLSPPPAILQPVAVPPVAPNPQPAVDVVAPKPDDRQLAIPSAPAPEPKLEQPAITAKLPLAPAPEPPPSATVATPAPQPADEPKPGVLPRPVAPPAASSTNRVHSAELCAQIRERAQLGDISKDERDILRTGCR